MTRSSITSSKSSGKTNTANSTSYITTKSTFPRSATTTRSCYPPDREFQPNMDEAERKRLLRQWARAVECSRGWAREDD